MLNSPSLNPPSEGQNLTSLTSQRLPGLISNYLFVVISHHFPPHSCAIAILKHLTSLSTTLDSFYWYHFSIYNTFCHVYVSTFCLTLMAQLQYLLLHETSLDTQQEMILPSLEILQQFACTSLRGFITYYPEHQFLVTNSYLDILQRPCLHCSPQNPHVKHIISIY